MNRPSTPIGVSRREIERRARVVIVRELMAPPARVNEYADFRTDLGADSLDIVTLTAALEEEFKVAISDDEAAFCQTVGTAIDLIETKLEGGAGNDARCPTRPLRAGGFR